jgi:transcriptional regulator with XRE-family HTH domain
MSSETGYRIKKLREFRNFTQTHMADKLSISQNAYSKIESGTTQLTTDRLEQIAKVLDVPMESILNSEKQIFNFDNSHIEKFYSHIENLHDENKEAWQKAILILEEQNQYLKEQNSQLIKVIETMSKK